MAGPGRAGRGRLVTLLDLGDLPTLTLPPLPVELRAAVVLTPHAWCPFCQGPVAGLLAGCDKPDCKRLELDADHIHARLADI